MKTTLALLLTFATFAANAGEYIKTKVVQHSTCEIRLEHDDFRLDKSNLNKAKKILKKKGYEIVQNSNAFLLDVSTPNWINYSVSLQDESENLYGLVTSKLHVYYIEKSFYSSHDDKVMELATEMARKAPRCEIK